MFVYLCSFGVPGMYIYMFFGSKACWTYAKIMFGFCIFLFVFGFGLLIVFFFGDDNIFKFYPEYGIFPITSYAILHTNSLAGFLLIPYLTALDAIIMYFIMTWMMLCHFELSWFIGQIFVGAHLCVIYYCVCVAKRRMPDINNL